MRARRSPEDASELHRTLVDEVDDTTASRETSSSWATQDRYERRALLGVGGMGEVHLCHDRVLGRDVALKRVRGDVRVSEPARARFEREMLVQARLEHPAIVAVYDVVLDHGRVDGFTMKRIRGRSLESVLDGMRGHAGSATTPFSVRQLLAAFVRVCLAVDYAHVRNVVHRDLKPANVMLGEFGEVTVLDWGLAKVMDQDEPTTEMPSTDTEDRTLVGMIMGTPGYLAPEQARGERVDARSDVYALGAILIEILTLEPLHLGDKAMALVHSTVQGVDARPSARGHTVAPELEHACVHATALDPAQRLSSARVLAEIVERYLDGARDLDRRRDVAREHVMTAKAKLGGASPSDRPRVAALRHLGHAVALDPTNEDALEMLSQLVVESPEALPAEAQQELETSRYASRRAAAGHAARRYLVWCAYLPLVFAMGIRAWPTTIAIIVLMTLAALDAMRISRRAQVHLHHGVELLLASSVAIALMSSLFGPFVLVPGLAATNTMYFAMNAERRHRPFVIAVGVVAMLAPFAVEQAGWVPPSYAFEAGAMRVLERATHFPPLWTTIALVVLGTATVVVPALMVGRMRDALQAAEQRVFLQAWTLRQMLPARARERVARS